MLVLHNRRLDMNKFILSVLLCFFAISTANAKVTLVVDWKAEMPNRVNDQEIEGTSCEKKCPGYSIKTTYCYDYTKVLESCLVYGCSHYHKCVPQKQ